MLPGAELNDFFVRVENSEVTPERPTSARSVEISLKIRHDLGAFLNVCLFVCYKHAYILLVLVLICLFLLLVLLLLFICSNCCTIANALVVTDIYTLSKIALLTFTNTRTI